MNKVIRPFVYIVLLSVAACGPADKPKDGDVKPAKVVIAPEFIADSAYAFIEKQVAFGPRVPNTDAHKKCAEYLINELKEVTDTVIVQRGTVNAPGGRSLDIYNIMGRLYPNTANRVMLFSHWDSRHVADNDTERRNEPILAASDGASGVAVLLEMARVIHSKNPGIGVDIMFIDAEDQGVSDVENSYCLGTQYWATNPPIPFYNPQYAILLDMVGGKNATFYKEGTSVLRYNAGWVVDRVWTKAAELGYGSYFVDKVSNGVTDDHTYVNEMTKIPAIDIIQYDPNTKNGFPYYWHTHKDNMDAIDKNTLKAVGQTLLGVIYNENPQ